MSVRQVSHGMRCVCESNKSIKYSAHTMGNVFGNFPLTYTKIQRVCYIIAQYIIHFKVILLFIVFIIIKK